MDSIFRIATRLLGIIGTGWMKSLKKTGQVLQDRARASDASRQPSNEVGPESGRFTSWGPAFDGYVTVNLGGAPFLPPDEAWWTQLGSAVRTAYEIYGSGMFPIVSPDGQSLDLEIGYALFGGESYGENLPGARVERVGATTVIAVHINTFGHFWALAADLMCCPDFLPEIGTPDPDDEPDARHAFGFLPVVSPSFDRLALSVVGRGPSCDVRDDFTLVFRDLMIEAVLTHEIGHAILGDDDFEKFATAHLDTERIKAVGGLFQHRAILHALMENDADDFSAKGLAVRIKSGIRMGFESNFELSDHTWIVAHLMARFFVAATWMICEIMNDPSTTLSDDTDWDHYPPGLVRLFNTVPHYQSFLVDELGYSAETTEAAIDEFWLRIAAIIDRFNVFRFLSLGLDPDYVQRQLEKLERYQEKLSYHEERKRFRFASSDPLATPSRAHGTLARQLNDVPVAAELLQGAYMAVIAIEPSARTGFVRRCEAILSYLQRVDADKRSEVGPAAVYRLEELARVIGDSDYTGRARPDDTHKRVEKNEELFRVLSALPLVENDADQVTIDDIAFWQAMTSAGQC